MRRVFVIAVLLFVACEERAPSSPSPAQTAVAKVSPSPNDGSRWDAKKGAVTLSITNTPGIVVDTNAPPPPPGSKPSQHPFLGASCSGDALGCSEAGNLLRASTSTADFLERLRKSGFHVEAAR